MENKNQKRALSFSMLSIVLCVAMLIGTTFAWFTDNASTGVNLIQAGTLDIELQKSEDNGKTWTTVEENESLAFQKAAEGEEILWEPGVTYNLPLLRVVNKGNLALKYKIQISGLDGNAELLNAIDFTLKNGEEMVDLTTYEGHIAGMQESGSPTVDKELSSLTISGHMRESAGNEYQGLTLNGIYITVAATQDTVESDSFNNAYDENAKYGTPVSSQEELLAALAKGEDVILTQSIVLPESIKVAGNVTIYGSENGSLSIENGDNKRVIDINNQNEPVTMTLSGVNVVGPTSGTYTRGISVYANSDVTIVVDNCSVSANYYALNIASENQKVNAVIKNTTLTGWCAAQTHSPNTKVTFENCKLIGNNDKTYNAEGWNNFATIVVNELAGGSEWTFNNCIIEANETTGNKQYLFSLRSACTINMNGCILKVNGNEVTADDAPISVYNVTGITINIDGETIFSK